MVRRKSPEPPAPPFPGGDGALRLCLDLNVWVAAYLSDVKGDRRTAAQTLVDVARRGLCALGPTQIVVSWGMLSRLARVLETRLGVPSLEAEAEIERIARYASYGPAGNAPYVLLGGTGLMPLRDGEDVHVLDTAVAGGAHVLATASFDDVLSYRTEIVVPGRIALHEWHGVRVIIAHPFDVARWTHEGRISFE